MPCLSRKSLWMRGTKVLFFEKITTPEVHMSSLYFFPFVFSLYFFPLFLRENHRPGIPHVYPLFFPFIFSLYFFFTRKSLPQKEAHMFSLLFLSLLFLACIFLENHRPEVHMSRLYMYIHVCVCVYTCLCVHKRFFGLAPGRHRHALGGRSWMETECVMPR